MHVQGDLGAIQFPRGPFEELRVAGDGAAQFIGYPLLDRSGIVGIGTRELIRGVPDDLGSIRSSHQLQGGRVAINDERPIVQDDGIPGGFEQCTEARFAFQHPRLRFLAIGDIPPGAVDHRFSLKREGRQRDLDKELTAVLAQVDPLETMQSRLLGKVQHAFRLVVGTRSVRLEFGG